MYSNALDLLLHFFIVFDVSDYLILSVMHGSLISCVKNNSEFNKSLVLALRIQCLRTKINDQKRENPHIMFHQL